MYVRVSKFIIIGKTKGSVMLGLVADVLGLLYSSVITSFQSRGRQAR